VVSARWSVSALPRRLMPPLSIITIIIVFFAAASALHVCDFSGAPLLHYSHCLVAPITKHLGNSDTTNPGRTLIFISPKSTAWVVVSSYWTGINDASCTDFGTGKEILPITSNIIEAHSTGLSCLPTGPNPLVSGRVYWQPEDSNDGTGCYIDFTESLPALV
jgi:hypothetical protein